MLQLSVDQAVTIPVNTVPLVSSSDFMTVVSDVAYNNPGMSLSWNFVSVAGAVTRTAVTPATSGNYQWNALSGGMYSIYIPASGGASANNDTEGYGWISGVCDAVLAFAGPLVTFGPANVVNSFVAGSDLLQVDVRQVNDDASAATLMGILAKLGVQGTVDDTAFPPTTQEFEADDITTAAPGHYVGRSLVFRTGTLTYHATRILDYSLVSSRGHFSVATLPSAPANDVTFVIV